MASWPRWLPTCALGHCAPACLFLSSFFLNPAWDGKGCQETRDCQFSFPFMSFVERGWASQKESFSLSSSGLQKKNHIFSYCHCCCHMKFSNLTISVLCDVFTYFITFRWSCCFSLGACLRVPVASKHTYRLEKWPWTLPKKKMSRRWWPSLRNRQRCGFTARLNSFSVPIIGIRFHCSLEFF